MINDTNKELNELIRKPVNLENIKPIATVMGNPIDEPYEPDYDDFGEYLESIANLSENYEITEDWSTSAITNCSNDDACPAEGGFEIEYCGEGGRQVSERYYLDIEKYYTELEVDGMPIRGQFCLKDFLKDGCKADFSFELNEIIGVGVFYTCRLLNYELN